MRHFHTLLLSTCLLLALPLAVSAEAAEGNDSPAKTVELNRETEAAPATAEAAEKDVAAKPDHPLLQALVAAYNNNPQLKAEREALQATDEGVAQAVSGFRPAAYATYEKGRSRRRTGAADWGYLDTKSKGVTVEQPIFNGGETLYGYKSARQQVKAGRAILQSVEQNVLFSTVDAYSNVVQQQSVLALNRKNMDVLNRQLGATQSRFDVGTLTRTDVAQSRARLAQAEADLRQAEGDLKAAIATFERIVGYKPENLLPPSLTPPLPATLDEALAVAKERNPALIAAEHLEKANDYATNTRIGALLPQVSIRGDISRSDGSGFFGSTRFDNDSLTLNVTVPLYQSGAEYSRVREAKKLHRQSAFTTIDTQNAVVENVTQAYGDYQAALAVIESMQSAIDAAGLANEGVRSENEYGVRTILDVLDSEQELFRTRVNLVRAERNKELQAYRLLAATGRLTARDLDLPVEPYDPEENYDTVKWIPFGF